MLKVIELQKSKRYACNFFGCGSRAYYEVLAHELTLLDNSKRNMNFAKKYACKSCLHEIVNFLNLQLELCD